MESIFVVGNATGVVELSGVGFLVVRGEPPRLGRRTCDFCVASMYLVVSLVFAFLSYSLREITTSTMTVTSVTTSPLEESVWSSSNFTPREVL